MITQRIGLTWGPTGSSGWGIFGLNLTLELLKGGGPAPLLLSRPVMDSFTPEQQAALAPLAREQEQLMAMIHHQGGGAKATLKDAVIIHALVNQFYWDSLSDLVVGRKNVGFIFFEDAYIDGEARKRASRFDRILVGSTWNMEVLKQFGLEDVGLAIQGIDHSRFQPRPGTGKYGDRLVIYSGGKLEARKSQDIVVAAFKVFHQRHPDSLLVTAWHNPWPDTARDMSLSPHVDAGPEKDESGRLAIIPWIQAQGVAADSVVDLGWVTHDALPGVLAEADVGLFPNRAEGGTNLVAMEAMACGLPCILSANTGHLDLISGDNCYPLRDQPPVCASTPSFKGWGESSVDEIVDVLEKVYQDRDEAGRRGRAGAEFMQDFAWSKQVPRLLEAIADLL